LLCVASLVVMQGDSDDPLLRECREREAERCAAGRAALDGGFGEAVSNCVDASRSDAAVKASVSSGAASVLECAALGVPPVLIACCAVRHSDAASESSRQHTVAALASRGVDPYCESWQGWSAACTAARSGAVSLRALLTAYPTLDVNRAQSADALTPLHAAAAAGDARSVYALLDRGASRNIVDAAGRTAHATLLLHRPGLNLLATKLKPDAGVPVRCVFPLACLSARFECLAGLKWEVAWGGSARALGCCS
jgi:hypothetical protein